MNDLMARMLDLDPGSTLETWTLSLRSGWPLAGLIGLLLLAAAGSALLYVREESLRPSVRTVLAVLRMLAVGVLLIMMFRPAVQATITRLRQSAVLVLVDRSESMGIRDTRKEPAALVEAGLVLGRLPAVAPELGGRVLEMRVTSGTAAKMLQRGDRETAEELIAELDDEAASVGQLATMLSPTLDDGVLAQFQSLGERISALVPELGPEVDDRLTHAAALRAIADDLAAWYEQVVVSQSPMDDAMRAELTLVSRQELVDAAVEVTSRSAFRQIANRSHLRMFSFSSGLEELTADTAGGRIDRDPEVQAARVQSSEFVMNDSATALGDALMSALDRSAGEPVSAVVVLTDGASNTGSDVLAAARELHGRGVRLVSVGVGLPAPDDASLSNLVAPNVVFADDLVLLRVQCRASGYEKRTTTLMVRLDGDEVARRAVTFTGQAQFEDLSFNASSVGGSHELEVSLAPLPGEATIENNVLRRNLRILDDKIRVLYIEGAPRWEYRYIRAVLKRDPRIDVQFINTEGDKELARASKEHLGRFPETESEAFQYDLVILGDVKASTFTPTQLELMERLVRERGGSMIALAGRKHLPAEYVDTPVAAMLPVRFDEEPWVAVGDDVHPLLTAEGRRSTVMALEDSGSRSQSRWSNLRPLREIPPVTGAKPGAHVLAELSDSSQPMPLIAWHRYGAGKVMFIGTDQLWRLRARAGDKYHLRFWGQAIQFLTLSRLLGENRLVQLQTGRERYALGEPVEVFATAANDLYEPLADPTFSVKVTDADGGGEGPLTLNAVRGMPGLYHGFHTPRRAGRYRVTTGEDTSSDELAPRSVSSGAGEAGVPLDVQFEVLGATSEQVQTAMQRDLLVQMASVTGGDYLPLRDLSLLPQLVPEATSTTTYTRDFELWDHWLFALIFVGLVVVEWAWRRHSSLA